MTGGENGGHHGGGGSETAPHGYATGGQVRGPGEAADDSIDPAWSGIQDRINAIHEQHWSPLIDGARACGYPTTGHADPRDRIRVPVAGGEYVLPFRYLSGIGGSETGGNGA